MLPSRFGPSFRIRREKLVSARGRLGLESPGRQRRGGLGLSSMQETWPTQRGWTRADCLSPHPRGVQNGLRSWEGQQLPAALGLETALGGGAPCSPDLPGSWLLPPPWPHPAPNRVPPPPSPAATPTVRPRPADFSQDRPGPSLLLGCRGLPGPPPVRAGAFLPLSPWGHRLEAALQRLPRPRPPRPCRER